jgi:hypothetical protein
MKLVLPFNVVTVFRKYKLFIIAVGVIFFYFLVVSPFIGKWQSVKNEKRILQKKFTKTLSLLEDERRINAIYNALSKVMNIRSAEKIDFDKEITDTYNFLLQNANRLGVRIMNFKPRKPKTKRGKEYKVIEMNLDIQATMPEFVRYIYYLENSAQLIEIESANIRTSSRRGLYFRVRLKKILL